MKDLFVKEKVDFNSFCIVRSEASMLRAQQDREFQEGLERDRLVFTWLEVMGFLRITPNCVWVEKLD